VPERTSYEPGTPSWADLGTSDPDAAETFYGNLFGWESVDAGRPEETGDYAFFTKGGRRVAGVGALISDGQPVAWSTYVHTDDLDDLARRMRDAGAMTLLAPATIAGSGRLTWRG
jgi:predicted enzyme related to lactoylglutathione lyase